MLKNTVGILFNSVTYESINVIYFDHQVVPDLTSRKKYVWGDRLYVDQLVSIRGDFAPREMFGNACDIFGFHILG